MRLLARLGVLTGKFPPQAQVIDQGVPRLGDRPSADTLAFGAPFLDEAQKRAILHDNAAGSSDSRSRCQRAGRTLPEVVRPGSDLAGRS